jgi:hypothetical protein
MRDERSTPTRSKIGLINTKTRAVISQAHTSGVGWSCKKDRRDTLNLQGRMFNVGSKSGCVTTCGKPTVDEGIIIQSNRRGNRRKS